MKVLTGIVTSTKMNKTAVVKVNTSFSHKIYGKIVKKSKKYKADTNGIEVKEGDKVSLKSSKPISKDKHWVIEKI